MKKTKHKFLKIILLFLSAIIIGSIIYNVYDNNRFIVTEQTIQIETLPSSFDGFRILQISDLHGKFFGDEQENLVDIINSLNYDAIVFTGDMNQLETSSVEDSQAILTLLSNIRNKENMLWVDGNTGPFAIETIDGSYTGNLTEIGKLLEEIGCKILLTPISISKGNDKIWFVPEMSEINYLMLYENIELENVGSEQNFANIQTYYNLSKDWYDKLNHNGETKIWLNHYPIQTNMTQEEWNNMGYLDFDLIIAGHYHGGQFRIPFFGAFYIPSPTSGKGGYFPKQKDVKGLNYINGTQQYVSAGLGASASIDLFDFRLFNTPEVNLITLTCK